MVWAEQWVHLRAVHSCQGGGRILPLSCWCREVRRHLTPALVDPPEESMGPWCRSSSWFSPAGWWVWPPRHLQATPHHHKHGIFPTFCHSPVCFSVLASLQGITAWVGDMIYSFCPSVKGCLLGVWRGKTEFADNLAVWLRAGKSCRDCTLAWDAAVVPSSAGSALAVPTGSGDMVPCS